MKKLFIALVILGMVFGQAPVAGAADSDSGAPQALKEKLKTIVSLSFTRADLKTTLVAMGKLYDVNILAGDDVRGTVTVSLKDVTIEDALKSILRMNNYTYLVEGEIIQVVAFEEEKITDCVNLNFIEGSLAAEMAGKILSQDATVKINESMNQLVITDKPVNIEKVRDFLKRIDLPPQQVMIEAKLVDISHSDLDNLGISWTGSLNLKMPFNRIKPGKWHRGGEGGADANDTKLTTFDGDITGPSTDLSGGQLALGFVQGASTLDVTIDALVQNQKAKLLACPTIAALNNVEARITIGEKYPIREQTQTTTGTLETTRFVDVGITLKVTPKITRDGYIQMAVHPEVSSVSSTLDAGPRITTREADTTVIVPDNQTFVIAGLIKDDGTTTNSKVPVLGYLPIVGLLFSNRAKSIDQKELAIFITPHLINVEKDNPIQLPQDTFEGISGNLSAVSLYEHARDLELGESLAARNKQDIIRCMEAARMYEDLADQFPIHPLAPEAMYRAAGLNYSKLGNLEKAKELYEKIVKQYKHSTYVKDSQRAAAKIDKRLKKLGA